MASASPGATRGRRRALRPSPSVLCPCCLLWHRQGRLERFLAGEDVVATLRAAADADLLHSHGDRKIPYHSEQPDFKLHSNITALVALLRCQVQ